MPTHTQTHDRVLQTRKYSVRMTVTGTYLYVLVRHDGIPRIPVYGYIYRGIIIPNNNNNNNSYYH